MLKVPVGKNMDNIQFQMMNFRREKEIIRNNHMEMLQRKTKNTFDKFIS